MNEFTAGNRGSEVIAIPSETNKMLWFLGLETNWANAATTNLAAL
jgi:hypothetical protein